MPPAVDEGAPPSRFDLDCDDLVEGLALEDRIPGAVLRTDPVSDFLGGFGSVGMLERFPIIQAGGLVCDWSAVAAMEGQFGDPDGYTGLQVRLLPDATDLWAAYLQSDYYYGDDAGVWYCFNHTERPSTFCNFEKLIGATWVSIQATDIDPHSTATDQGLADSVRPFFDAIVKVVAASGTTAGQSWSVQGAPALTSDCEALVPINDVYAATGLSEPVAYWGDFYPGIGLQSTAAHIAVGTVFCEWTEGYETYNGGVVALPSGAWALHQLLARDSTATPLPIDGLATADGAWARGDGSDGCLVDLDLGGNWIELTLRGHPDVETISTPSTCLAALTELATGLVSRS